MLCRESKPDISDRPTSSLVSIMTETSSFMTWPWRRKHFLLPVVNKTPDLQLVASEAELSFSMGC
jgi:hypothetical protein